MILQFCVCVYMFSTYEFFCRYSQREKNCRLPKIPKASCMSQKPKKGIFIIISSDINTVNLLKYKYPINLMVRI